MYRETKVTNPRKEYKCVWCGEPITGEHIYRAYIFDSAFQYDRMHPECHDASASIWVELEDGFEEGSFQRGTIEGK